jgi:hypothetical protein
MPQDLEHLREDINALDCISGMLREEIYDIDEDDEYYLIIDKIDDLLDAITLIQMKQKWI